MLENFAMVYFMEAKSPLEPDSTMDTDRNSLINYYHIMSDMRRLVWDNCTKISITILTRCGGNEKVIIDTSMFQLRIVFIRYDGQHPLYSFV